MWIIPMRSMVGEYGSLRRNRPAEIPDHLAQALIARGRAVPLPPVDAGGNKPAENPPNAKEAAPAGGRTGKAKQSPSSPEVPAPETQVSTQSEGAPEQLPLTTPGS